MIPDSIPSHLLDWLLSGDVAIQYQARRDLLSEERPDLRARLHDRLRDHIAARPILTWRRPARPVAGTGCRRCGSWLILQSGDALVKSSGG
jgi:hypothetical protein